MSKKALVVDNDFFFVEFLSELLIKRGYEVTKAYDGKEAISEIDKGPFDFISMDLVMPKIDGKQVIRFIREKFPDASFPIVIVSGTIIEQMDKFSEIGADYYIAKGPMDEMEAHLKIFMDKIEKQPLPGADEEIFLEPGKLYPRRVTADLMDSVNFQKAITDSIGTGIIVVDRDGRIITANASAIDMTGKSFDEILACPVTGIFPRNENGKIVDALKRLVHNQELRKVTLSIGINIREIWMTVSLFKLSGKIAGWVISMGETNDG